MNKIITANFNYIKDSINNINVYDFIELCMSQGLPFTVCNVTKEEFKIMENELKRSGYLGERLADSRFHEYNSCRFMITRDSDVNKILFADYNNHDKRGFYAYDFSSNQMQYFADGIQFTEYYSPSIAYNGYSRGFKIYTTETYDYVVDYYKELSIDKDKIYKKVHNQ